MKPTSYTKDYHHEVKCPQCEAKMRNDNLERHIYNKHTKTKKIKDEYKYCGIGTCEFKTKYNNIKRHQILKHNKWCLLFCIQTFC